MALPADNEHRAPATVGFTPSEQLVFFFFGGGGGGGISSH